jgi:hypothetical protein
MAKLRKYFPKQGLKESTRSLYLSLILDSRIKKEGLKELLDNREAVDIKNKLEVEYNK